MGFWGYLFVACIGWGIWSTVPTNSCDRVGRMAAPVRGLGQGLAYGVKNWVEPKTYDDIRERVEESGQMVEQFFATEFFGDKTVCKWGYGDGRVPYQTTGVQKVRDGIKSMVDSNSTGNGSAGAMLDRASSFVNSVTGGK